MRFDKWLFLQLTSLISLGPRFISHFLEDLILHTFPLPFWLVKFDYQKLYDAFSEYGSAILDEAEKKRLTPSPSAAVMVESPATTTKSYWRFSKNDFYSEPTFRKFETYLSTVSDTPSQLKDRLLRRSSDMTELVELKKQSENPMHRCLTSWDLVWLAFGSVVGLGIFSITNDVDLAIVLSYAISGFSALLSVFCYAEFAVDISIAGETKPAIIWYSLRDSTHMVA